MQEQRPGERTTRIAQLLRALPLLLGIPLAGCASNIEGSLIFADEGKYQFHNCDQLATAAKKTAEREQELKQLIDKAEQGAGGLLVGAIAYRSDYIAAEEDLRVIEGTARAKKCLIPATWRSNAVIR
jgi:hypothetical protein